VKRVLAAARAIGKDTVIVAIVALAFISVIRMADADAQQYKGVDTALVFVVDISASMDQRQLRIAREGHAEAIMSQDVLNAIQSGYFQQSAFAFVEFSSRAATTSAASSNASRPSARGPRRSRACAVCAESAP
jgi:hypothetical protein